MAEAPPPLVRWRGARTGRPHGRHPRWEDQQGPRTQCPQKKAPELEPGNRPFLEWLAAPQRPARLTRVEEAEADERWSDRSKTKAPRWWWQALDPQTGTVLASVFGRREDKAFLELKALLQPFGIG